ncbi:MAG TPA: methyltransferase domain-containing protein [Nocardioides sp.]|uniref:class I SAM-dependent methyltransferase n=1 Tax=Nocardioides sp. TaxID=35761 RepID=UPI002F3FCB37
MAVETGENPWPGMFDTIADQYDQSGVAWFKPIAGGLVELLDPRPGERFLELGPGRGALTVPLAEAVGPDGGLDALDMAPSMVRLLREDLDRRGVTNVSVGVGDASDPRPPGSAYDGVAASLVLFFLPDPVAGLVAWHRLVRPGGRAGIATFQPWVGRFAELLGMVEEYAGPAERGGSPFDTDAGVEDLFRQAGFADVRTVLRTFPISFRDLDQWHTWSQATALRRVWTDTDPAQHPEILERARAILDGARDADGRIVLDIGIRYTLALR